VGYVDAHTRRELVGGHLLTGTGSVPARRASGLAFNCTATGLGVEVLVPERLKLSLPLTLDAWFVPTGAADAFSAVFGLTHNNTDSSPFDAVHLSYTNTGTAFRVSYSSGGNPFALNSATGPTTGLLSHLLAVMTATTQDLYLNGVKIASASSAISAPNFGATALLTFGNYTGVSRNSALLGLCGRVWNRALSTMEIGRLYDPATRWDLDWTPSTRVYEFFGASVGGGGGTPLRRPTHFPLMGVC
jgi:hypothetical protein